MCPYLVPWTDFELLVNKGDEKEKLIKLFLSSLKRYLQEVQGKTVAWN